MNGVLKIVLEIAVIFQLLWTFTSAQQESSRLDFRGSVEMPTHWLCPERMAGDLGAKGALGIRFPWIGSLRRVQLLYASSHNMLLKMLVQPRRGQLLSVALQLPRSIVQADVVDLHSVLDLPSHIVEILVPFHALSQQLG